jgi:hypothetical protein
MGVSLQLPTDLPIATAEFVAGQFVPALEEVHFMLSFIRIENGKSAFPLIWSLSTVLLSLVDAVSFWFDSRHDFVATVTNHYPWKIDPPPSGYTKQETSQALYEAYRNRFIHRLGAHIRASRRTDNIYPVIGFTLKSTTGIDNLANAERPIRPLLSAGEGKLILNLDTLYWGLRRISEKLLSIPEQRAVVENKIKSLVVF